MASPGAKITTQQLYALIQILQKKVKYLEKVVEECCLNPTSFSTAFQGQRTTSNTGGYGSSINTSSSSGIGSLLTSGTGSNSPPQSGMGAKG